MPAAGNASSLKIRDIIAMPTSFPVRAEDSVTLGVGRAVKRDAIIVKVITESGLVGYGEAHHGRAPGAVARLVESTVRQLAIGHDAADVVGLWKRVYDKQLASHGMGAGASLALSGLDMALWDIRGKAAGMPLYRMLGGGSRAVPAYAGGVSLGYQPPEQLVEEARVHVDAGYRAVKLRLGDNVKDDIARVAAVRHAFGNDLVILTDANTGYDVKAARAVMPQLDAYNVSWLEEPFAAHDYHSYQLAAGFGRTPLAAGENHYTRYEFQHVQACEAITIWQPDLSKSGGLTEVLRIAAMASARKIPVHPHTSMTGLNMAACVHFLCAIDNGGYFEADVSKNNRFRDELVDTPFRIAGDGTVRPLEGPGLGVDVDENFLARHPLIDGPAYV